MEVVPVHYVMPIYFPLTFSGDGEREGGREKEAAGVGDATQEREEINKLPVENNKIS